MSTLRPWTLGSLALVCVAILAAGCGESGTPATNNTSTSAEVSGGGDDAQPAQELTLYSGRSRSLVEPIIERFEREHDITVNPRYGSTAQLAVALKEEGDQSRADVFWAQDAGALGALAGAERFAALPDDVLQQVPERYRNPDGVWIATTGRARTLAYAPDRIGESELPASVFDLTDEQYQGRVGWAPTNASFQAFVTAMRNEHGDDRTRQWLEDMNANGARSYPKNSAIIQAIAAGEVDLGLPNHYYLLRFKGEDPDYPVEQTFFEAGDVGNLVNVAGVGMLATSEKQDAALTFVRYLLSEEAQQYFAQEVYEYPVIDGVSAPATLPPREQLDDVAPRVDLDNLEDLEATLDLLRDAGAL
ncbi:MAG: iron ABC transporter substrate-binding protein [Phycisphaeraceae bacterium]